MIKLNFIYSEEKDIERVFYIINKWDFYQQYYNFDWIKLPIKLD